MERKPGFYWVRTSRGWTVLEWASSMLGPGWVEDGLVVPDDPTDDEVIWIEPPAA